MKKLFSFTFLISFLLVTTTIYFLFQQDQLKDISKHQNAIHLRSAIIYPTKQSSSIKNLLSSVFHVVAENKQQSYDPKEIKSWILHFTSINYLPTTTNNKFETLEQYRSFLQKEFNLFLGEYVPHRSFIISGTEKNIYNLKAYYQNLFGDLNSCTIEKYNQEFKSVNRDHLEIHLEKSVLVDRVVRGDVPYDSSLKDTLKLGRRLLNKKDQAKDVNFIIMVTVPKFEKKEDLEKELKEGNLNFINNEKDLIRSDVVSNDKIAISVNGHRSTIELVEKLRHNGLVHYVDVKTATTTHGKYSTGLIQSYSKPLDRPIWKLGLTGEGQVIGVGDTGVDYYHCFFYDDKNNVPIQRRMKDMVLNNNHRKFAGFWSYMDDKDSERGHGTHVAGIAAGKCHETLSSPQELRDYDSLAKDAKLAFMDAGCDQDAGCQCPEDVQCECDMKPGNVCPKKFGVVYLPLDLYEYYFPYFYAKGARVTSSSWGTGFFRDFGFGYSTNSKEIDRFAWEHKDFLPVFAAGNSGGAFGYASLTAEAESKNALSVGASLNMLDSFNQAINVTSYTVIIDRLRTELYQRYCLEGSDMYDPKLCETAKNFKTEKDCCNDKGACPVKSASCCGVQDFYQFKTIGFKCCPECIKLEMQSHPEYYSERNLAVFTARGPTLDGRIKPDVVTVGEKIASSLSLGNDPNKRCGMSKTIQDQMVYHEGTSMAAPLAAGAAVLVRQFYQQGYHTGAKNPTKGFTPSAALIKATLIHSTRLLDGYVHLLSKHIYWPIQYQDGHSFSLQSTFLQGFGRIDLNNVLDPKMKLYIPNTQDATLTTGQHHEFCINVKSQANNPLRITLVWTDPPSSPAAKIHLINDLDLVVIGPRGDKYFGNGGKSSVKQTRDQPDQLNNVEQIAFETSDPIGRYSVIVRGNVVPQGPQPYALIISGDIQTTTGCAPYSFIPYAYLAEKAETYSSLSYSLGILSIICIPALAFLSLYLYMQYRNVTTGAKGYRESAMAKFTDSGAYIFSEDNTELKTLRRNYETEEDDDDLGLFSDNKEINNQGGTVKEKGNLLIIDKEE